MTDTIILDVLPRNVLCNFVSVSLDHVVYDFTEKIAQFDLHIETSKFRAVCGRFDAVVRAGLVFFVPVLGLLRLSYICRAEHFASELHFAAELYGSLCSVLLAVCVSLANKASIVSVLLRFVHESNCCS